MTTYRLGYARVSTLEQDPALQTDALTAAGVDRIYVDYACGARGDRPDVARLLADAPRVTPWWCGVWTGSVASPLTSSPR